MNTHFIGKPHSAIPPRLQPNWSGREYSGTLCGVMNMAGSLAAPYPSSFLRLWCSEGFGSFPFLFQPVSCSQAG